ncbi:hypothetical protein MHI57_24980 [Cytobacillus sp. FSL K6-0129]
MKKILIALALVISVTGILFATNVSASIGKDNTELDVAMPGVGGIGGN